MRAYFVLGPESSGTRMMTEILISAGCFGDATSSQRLDSGIPEGTSPIVWRRSAPHAQEYPPLGKMIGRVQGLGYDVRAIVMTRDWHAMLRSQVAWGHTPTVAKARERTRMGYLHIFMHLRGTGIPFTVVSYESLVQRSGAALSAVMDELDLPTPDFEIRDENAKWYEGVPA